ncbi:Transposable element tcb2 transposase [Caligus rogercresseyi]|uniref:Transposable element tcb2 transposase n=1 Tax=Caligus rogercresseyi TaxID=217165 RepID=A0A7T8QUI2_CALRO|nr:Transposable element tcb2 transposase [Caligus rogercresseyi]
MSSELECRTAIIVALRCGRAPKEIIDFFKFPKATVYSIAKSFKESRTYLSLPARWSSCTHVQFGAKLVLKEPRHVLVKGFLAPSSPDLNPCDYYLWCP